MTTALAETVTILLQARRAIYLDRSLLISQCDRRARYINHAIEHIQRDRRTDAERLMDIKRAHDPESFARLAVLKAQYANGSR